MEKNSKRILLLFLFIIVIGFVLIGYGLTKVSTSEVELIITSDRIKFTLNNDLQLRSCRATEISISNFSNIDLTQLNSEEPIIETSFSDEKLTESENYKTTNNLKSIFPIIQTNENSVVNLTSKSLNLEFSKIDSGAIITIKSDQESKNQFTITVHNGYTQGIIDVFDTLIIHGMNCQFGKKTSRKESEIKKIRIRNAEQLVFNDLYQKTNIVMRINDENLESFPLIIGERIPINEIEFTKLVGDLKESSIIKEGVIYFADLDGKRKEIKAGDFVIIEGLKNAQIKQISFGSGINMSFYGKVSELKTGIKSFCHSRLPKKIEWFYTNKNIAFLFAAIAGLYTFIISIFSIWKIVKKF